MCGKHVPGACTGCGTEEILAKRRERDERPITDLESAKAYIAQVDHNVVGFGACETVAYPYNAAEKGIDFG